MKLPAPAVIIDLALPGKSGWELLKEIQANPQTAALPCLSHLGYPPGGIRCRVRRLL
jgi:CheY-like chemotaxis protein